MVTKRGIYYNLQETTYYYKIEGYKFYFSSKKYRDKFIENYKSYVNYETLKIEYQLGTLINNSDYFYFKLYAKIEKRGFYIENLLTGKKYFEIPKINLLME